MIKFHIQLISAREKSQSKISLSLAFTLSTFLFLKILSNYFSINLGRREYSRFHSSVFFFLVFIARMIVILITVDAKCNFLRTKRFLDKMYDSFTLVNRQLVRLNCIAFRFFFLNFICRQYFPVVFYSPLQECS